MNEQEPIGYKMPPKHSQWKPGQSGNPLGKKKGTKGTVIPLQEILFAELYAPTTMTASGKKQQLALVQVLVRKTLHNLVNAPVKQQIEALVQFIKLGLLRFQDLDTEQQDGEFDPYTEEHRRLLKIIQEEMNESDLGE